MGGAARRPQLTALTSLRFFAALHVVLFHARGALNASSFPGHQELKNLLGAGPVSVGLFFVLSGFVLTYTYLGDPDRPRVRLRAFWVARLARVYPVYFLGLLLAAPFALTAAGVPAMNVWAAGVAVFVLVQAWVPSLALAWNPPAWSLSAEAFFYLAFPFAAPPLARLGRRGAFVALAVLWAMALAAPAAVLSAGAHGLIDLSYVPHGAEGPAWSAFLAYNPLVRLPEFLFGVVVARLYQLRRGPGSVKGSWLALIAVAVLAVLLACDRGVYGPFAGAVVNNGVLTPLFGLLVYGLACGGGRFAALLSRRPLVLLGEASYAVYILHVPVLMGLNRAFRAGVLSAPQLAWFFLYIFTVVVLSLFVFRFVEEPARRLIRRRFGG